ncbi:hypothetical protein EMIT0P100_30342 [Pseudomonas sp. IT-P100]
MALKQVLEQSSVVRLEGLNSVPLVILELVGSPNFFRNEADNEHFQSYQDLPKARARRAVCRIFSTRTEISFR